MICQEMNVEHLTIEGDSLMLIKAVQQMGNLEWSLMILWRQVQTCLATLRHCQSSIFSRTANHVTDSLTKGMFVYTEYIYLNT